MEIVAPGPSPPSAERLFCDIARARFDAQLDRNNSIESKAATMFTIGSTVLPITASLLTADRAAVLESAVSRWALGLGGVFYVILVAAFLLSYRLTGWQIRPELPQWREVTLGRTDEEMQRWLGNAYVEAHLSNEPQLRRKAALVGVVFMDACR